MDVASARISKDFLSKYVVILVGALVMCYWYYFNENNALLYYGILLNIILVHKLKNSKILQLVFLFMLTYLLNLIPYFSYGINIAYYEPYARKELFESVLFLHVLFLFVLYLFIGNKVNKNKETLIGKVNMKDNLMLYGISIAVMSFILAAGKTGHNLTESIGKGPQLTEGLAINEYFLVFTFVAYVFSGNQRFRNAIILILSVLYIAKNTIAEGRIESLQLIILLFVLYVDKKRISNVLFWIGTLVGYSLMSVFEKVRIGTVSFYKIGENGSPYLESNQGDVFYSSSVYVGLVKENIFNDSFRLHSFIGYIERIFLPSKFAASEANVSLYSKSYTPSGGGGLISAYFYVWLSYIGVVLIAVFLAWIINKLYITKNPYFLFYIIMVVVTFPRWFAYDPITLFKLTSYGVIIFFGFMQLDLMLNKYNRKIAGRMALNQL
ncbi:hypothetical protein [Paenibacillus mendelii]|uniref:Oligosaccharide repeat unit polymerase n=1 Tax=Paenibacillus mendelii TaxID=206163 RepID=A0ABV6JJ82_9BACL|nr:hypothetical protein [Paenibacillus mendelii]MCQ6558897.1 hypothetical protein [Paenibacillus mendelii]